MRREFEAVAIMMRQAYKLVSLKPLGHENEDGVYDRALQVRIPKDMVVEKGDKFAITVERVVEAVDVTPELDSVEVGDEPGVDYEA